MNKMANHNWYIGQDIVCIKTHSRGHVKEGETYIIKSLREGFCKCTKVQISIGMKSNNNYQSCTRCGITMVKKGDNSIWFSERLFAPLDSLTDISEIQEILNQPIEQLFQIK